MRKTKIFLDNKSYMADITISIEKYLNLLKLLNDKRLFGKLVIYPAIGIDGLVALFAKRVLGLNWQCYNPYTILEHISPILSPELVSELKPKLEKNLTFISRIDASFANLLKKELEPYRHISPKSLMLKEIFKYVFLKEWDSDVERFYDVSPKSAAVNANRWINEMINWLNIGDFVIVFDRHFFPFLTNHKELREIDISIQDLGENFDKPYKVITPIIIFSSFVRVFKKH